MKIQILSDLHLEFSPKSLPIISAEADLLAYAGDVCPNLNVVRDYFDGVRKQTSAPIVYVLGNHEYYGKYLHSGREFIRALQGVPNLHVLCDDSAVFGDVRVLGTTLWTDYNDRREEVAALIGMVDFDHIRKPLNSTKFSTITPADIVEEHRKAREFLDREFGYAQNQKQKTVVVTHHGPSYYLIPQKYIGNKLNGSFFVELSNLIMREKPVLWIYGHSHTSGQHTIGSTKLVCNPWGYPFEKDTEYQESLIVEV
jgi:Icc-related predicted phosphoesterase